jgi:hypothetical protein
LPDGVFLTALDLDDKDLLQIIMPPEGLTSVRCEIDLDIDGGMKQLGELVAEGL